MRTHDMWATWCVRCGPCYFATGGERTAEYTNRVGNHLLETMHGLAAKYPIIGDVRGKGLWISIEFVKDRSSKEPARELVDKLLHTAFHNGLLLLSCGVSTLRLMPPLMISRELADEAVAILDQSIAETLQQMGG